MKPLAVAFSDLHIHNWKAHNKNGNRSRAHTNALLEIGGVAKDLRVPCLFSGDISHAFGKIDLELWDIFMEVFYLWGQNNYPMIYGITGNHDQESANYDSDKQSRSTWELLTRIFPKILYNLDFAHTDTDNFRVMGIPYLTYNKSFDQWVRHFRTRLATTNANILLIHTDLHGAVDVAGREYNTTEEIPENMAEYFKDFDLVLSGHIHTPQKLGKNIIMVGSPLEQKRNDSGTDYGYWIIEGDPGKKPRAKFVPLFDYPKFIQLKPGEEPKDDHNYYLPAEEVIEKAEVDTGFSNTVSKEKLVKRYLKHIGETSVAKKKALIHILNEAEGDWQ